MRRVIFKNYFVKDKVFLICFLLLFHDISLLAKENDDFLIIKKISGKIVFDGICDENVWDSLNNIPLIMFKPNHGSLPTEKSDIFVTFDEDYFYVGARLHYENGARVMATTKKRDGADGGSDNFGILLDTFNDNENALCFETNPSGLRSDFSIGNDAQVNLGLRPFNRDWNTYWDVKTNFIGKILNIEIRIPLSSLRFQETDGKVIMGMSIWRQMASKQEWNVYPAVTNEFGSFGVWKPSQAHKIILQGLQRKNPVYITPYVLAGLDQASKLNATGTAYHVEYDPKLTAGLDVKYALTSNMTMDLTLNTDFAQVEVDDQMVNLTRFSLFFPEKRQFFVERSSIFTIRTGYLDELFYSRRIGLYEGEIIPIIGGTRLVGRVGKWDLGFLDMQTTSYDYTDEDTDSLVHLESTNYGVWRMRKQVFNKTSYAGGMVTSKIDMKGNYNINTALDLIYNPFRNDYITTNYVQTFDSDISLTHGVLDHGKFYIDWQNRSNVGFTYDFLFSHAGKYYNPEMGFEQMENYTRTYGSLGYGWVYNDESKKMLNQQLMIWTWINKRNEDFKTDQSKISIGYSFALKKGFRAYFDLFKNHEYLTEQFDLSDGVFFPVGFYDYYTMEGGLGTATNRIIALNAMYTLGSYYDGVMAVLGPAEITFRLTPSVNLGLSYQYSQVDIPVRDQYFTSHLIRLKSEFTFTTKLSLLMFFQYSSSDKFGVNNIRFRYNPREGNDLYLVYNGDYNTHLKREDPSLPLMDRNSFVIKYTYTLIWNK